jgi:hypothetical protein
MTIDQTADLSDVAAALRELAAALRPALTPATRPTWNQQRWAPGPDAFGVVAAPAAAVDPGGWPGHVVADELIESAWGNAVVDSFRWAHVNAGVGVYPSAPTLNGAAILPQAPPPVPYATYIIMTANGRAGSDSGTMDGVQLTVVPATSAAYSTVAGAQTPANRYGLQSLGFSWLVAANASPAFDIRVGWVSTGGGTTFVQADVNWHQYRAP